MDYKPHIIDALTVMMNKEKSAPGGHFKARAYDKVIKQLAAFKGTIQSMKDVAAIDGIGEKIHAKIVEILETGQLAAAERVKNDPVAIALDTLTKVHGIGPIKAAELINTYGIYTVEALRKRKDLGKLLNDVQRKGLLYYECFLERIPRAEMEQHESIILATITEHFGLEASIAGSYRRGDETSGDIDVIVKLPDNGFRDKEVLEAICDHLTKKKYIIETFALGSKKYMGASCIPGGTPRRLDIMVTTEETYPYALFYFTGSDKFNIAFRNMAIEKGYSLNEYSFTKLVDDVPNIPRIRTEQDIFKFLRIQYVAPCDRIDQGSIKPVRVLRIIRNF
jgi:DNA polymerase/3'-5' exonuclease PolX